MRSLIAKFTDGYGSDPLHLLGTVAAWGLAGYAVTKLGPHALWNHQVWWQSIGVWFLGAVVAHDLILFPLYALADRSIVGGLVAIRKFRPVRADRRAAVSPLNYLRVPALATGLSLLLFFPGIIEQGQASYLAATGQDQQPFLGRWLLLVAGLFGASALAYAARLGMAGRATTRTDADPGPPSP